MTRWVDVQRLAQADLDDAAEYIALDSREAAERFLLAAHATFADLLDSPRIGRCSEFRLSRLIDLRVWPVKGFRNYLIFYREITDGIQIIRVLHGARDIQEVLDEPQEEQ